MAIFNHQNNFGTNLTSNTSAGATTTPLNSIPTIDAPYFIALDATNVNSHYEVVLVTSDTGTNINHAATTYAHTTAEEVRLVIPATEMDSIWDEIGTGWFPIQTGASLTYSSADDPTYVVTTSTDLRTYVQVGDRVKFTNNATTFYGIITATAAGTLTLYGGTDYDVANSAITAVYFSHMKSPVGFPLDPTKWTVITSNSTETSQTNPVQDTWYNLGSINIVIPIGVWTTSWQSTFYPSSTGSNPCYMATLSTANNSESDNDFSTLAFHNGSAEPCQTHFRQKTLVLAAKTTYYLNAKMANIGGAGSLRVNPSFGSDAAKTIIRATIAYL